MVVHRRQFGLAFGVLAAVLVALSFVSWFSRQVDGADAVSVDVWHASTLWEWAVAAAVAGAVLAAVGALIGRAGPSIALFAAALGLEVVAVGLWLRQHWLLQFAPAYHAGPVRSEFRVIFVRNGKFPSFPSAEEAFPVAKNDLASYVHLPYQHAGETWVSQAGLTAMVVIGGLAIACWYRLRHRVID